jgi:hypothetical protein
MVTQLKSKGFNNKCAQISCCEDEALQKYDMHVCWDSCMLKQHLQVTIINPHVHKGKSLLRIRENIGLVTPYPHAKVMRVQVLLMSLSVHRICIGPLFAMYQLNTKAV